jgi:tetratricopeptide (TPR) repeat protein
MTQPATVAQLLEQGLFHHRQGDMHTAMERYVEALHIDPENADALYYVAVIACQGDEFQQGADLARRALSFGRPKARVHNLLGQALYRLGDRLEAIKNFDAAIALAPNLAEAHGNRANILIDAGFPDEALKSFDRALELNPLLSADWLNRGSLLQDLGRHAEALESFDKAILCSHDFAEAHTNRGNALKELGLIDAARGLIDSPRFAEAAAAYSKAIEIEPRLEEPYLGRGMLNLVRGDWAAGFPDYEHRSKVHEPTYAELPQPRWQGEPLGNERLVLVSEQGLGDTIQFCRVAPLLATRGFAVTLLTRKAMKPLLSTLRGVTIATEVTELTQDPRPLRWAPLLSVPGLLALTPDTVPAAVPYLSASPERVDAWRAKLGDGFKIGINWASGHSQDLHFTHRDIPLADFAPLAALPGVRLILLQKNEAAVQISTVPFGARIEQPQTDPHADADFFLDTAAVMMHLDLVVTCDTSVAHLAGALARPVFTALPVSADWRWLLGRGDTPWYPTMRLFRQDDTRQWRPVMERVAEAARDLASKHRP